MLYCPGLSSQETSRTQVRFVIHIEGFFYLKIKKYCSQLRLIVRVATEELDSVNLRVVREGGVSFRLKAADKRVAWRTNEMRKYLEERRGEERRGEERHSYLGRRQNWSRHCQAATRCQVQHSGWSRCCKGN